MLTEEKIKEKLSLCYVRAVAAICGYSFDVPVDDFDSVDAIITGLFDFEGLENVIEISRPRIEIQLKSTSQEHIAQAVKSGADEFSFPLPIKNYDDLRIHPHHSLRLLVVLVLPAQQHRWLKVDHASLILRRAAFWHNLGGLPESTNETSQTVRVQTNNLFTPSALQAMMEGEAYY